MSVATIDLSDLLKKKWQDCDCLEVVRIGIDRLFGFDLDTDDPHGWAEYFDDLGCAKKGGAAPRLVPGDVLVTEMPGHTGVCVVVSQDGSQAATSTPRKGVEVVDVSLIRFTNDRVGFYRLKPEHRSKPCS